MWKPAPLYTVVEGEVIVYRQPMAETPVLPRPTDRAMSSPSTRGRLVRAGGRARDRKPRHRGCHRSLSALAETDEELTILHEGGLHPTRARGGRPPVARHTACLSAHQLEARHTVQIAADWRKGVNRIAKSTKTVLPLLLVGCWRCPRPAACSQYLPLMTSFGNRLTLRRRPKGPPACS